MHPTRSFRAAAAALALCTASCSRAEQQVQGDNTTYSWEGEIRGLFQDNPDIASLALPRGRGAAKVCAAPDVLMALYPGRGIYTVTGDIPFAPVRDSSDVCSVRITSQPSPGRDIFIRPSCRIRVVTGGMVEVAVPETIDISQIDVSPFEGSDDEFIASECFYRLALVLEGYRGGLTTSTFGAHSNNAHFIGKRRYVGPIVTPLVYAIGLRCPDIRAHYYQPTLEPFVMGECLTLLREVYRVR